MFSNFEERNLQRGQHVPRSAQSSGTTQSDSQPGKIHDSVEIWESVQPRSCQHPLGGSLPTEKVIVISDDKPMGTVAPSASGGFEGTRVTVSAPQPPSPVWNRSWWTDSDKSLPSVHTEYDETKFSYGTSYVTVQYVPLAYNVIILFSSKLMTDPVDVEVHSTVEEPFLRLRRSRRDFQAGCSVAIGKWIPGCQGVIEHLGLFCSSA